MLGSSLNTRKCERHDFVNSHSLGWFHSIYNKPQTLVCTDHIAAPKHPHVSFQF
jgi:hypothetical protein